MSRPFPADPFLTGNFAPWPAESDVHDLVIEGALPHELEGTYVRNGANPQFAPRGRHHWFDGDGMLHAFRFHAGRVSYRNRFVRTARFALERAAGESLFGGMTELGKSDPRVGTTSPNAANTHVVSHAGRLLALWEGGPPHAVDLATLETLGPDTFGGKLAGSMTAHPKLDPESGELVFFGYGALPPYLRYHVLDRRGALTASHVIEIPEPVMMHDFAVTRSHAVFLVCPAIFDLPRALAGGPVFDWRPELGTRFCVVSRRDPAAPPRWLQTDASYVFHVMNAFDEGEHIVLDVARYERLPLFDDAGLSADFARERSARLVRWTLDLAGGGVKQEALDDVALEFPRLDERHAGLPYRFGYAALLGASGRDEFDGIARFDHARHTRDTWPLPPGQTSGEPVFVPRTPDAAEGEGFLLALVYRAEERTSDLVVLDAQRLADGPIARVRHPHRIPYGFHGSFVPAR